MNELTIFITKEYYFETYSILIDGTPVKFKKNKAKKLECHYQTPKDNVRIDIYKYADIGGFFWFITQVFFFLVSIFGLFDIYKKNKGIYLNCSLDVSLKDNSVLNIQCNKPKVNEVGVLVETDLSFIETNNVYLVDKKSKIILTLLRLTKVLTFFALVFLVIYLVIFI